MRRQQPLFVRVARIAVYLLIISINFNALLDLRTDSAAAKHGRVVLTALRRAIGMRYELIGGRHTLQIETMRALLPAVHRALHRIVVWTSNIL